MSARSAEADWKRDLLVAEAFDEVAYSLEKSSPGGVVRLKTAHLHRAAEMIRKKRKNKRDVGAQMRPAGSPARSGRMEGDSMEGDSMEDVPVFDKGKADLGIHAACEQFDGLGLTLTERWWAARCIEKASAAMLGERFAELAGKLEASGPVDVPVPAGVVGGVAHDGPDPDDEADDGSQHGADAQDGH